MENKGIEFEINATPVQTENFTWNVGYNISFNDNKLTNLPDEVEVGGINGGTGNNIQLHKEGYAPYSFWVYKQVYDDQNRPDRKSTRLNSSHVKISYAVFCLKKK